MKLPLSLFLLLGFSPLSPALTVEQQVNPAVVEESGKAWQVEAETRADGLIHFTIIRTLKEPKYLVAHVSVVHGGKVIATTDVPIFGRQHENTIYFALSPADLAESKFHLSEGFFQEDNGRGVPEPGTVIYQFLLPAFATAK